eukprot:TRINITY_DN4206_c0_g1_i1.p1 TRINITY_DN4206_c0_g1~~TRINITY_DN4206_c0_g1_i1.p1  ORF type:complete len:171 (+),score=8.86 TRINITY_DN4206_c0_g1_i1:132-644(+)
MPQRIEAFGRGCQSHRALHLHLAVLVVQAEHGHVLSTRSARGMAKSEARGQPQRVNEGYYDVGKGVRGARTDSELVDAIVHRKNNTVLVKYGTSWCHTCKAVLPHFLQFASKFNKTDYVIASVENMQEAVRDVKYSPHFAFFHKGRKVDEFYGNNVQRLRDRIWLHNERA